MTRSENASLTGAAMMTDSPPRGGDKPVANGNGRAAAGQDKRKHKADDTEGKPAIKVEAKKVSVHYDGDRALNKVSLAIPVNAVTSFIGPSGCGKSTFLRCFNRMNDVIPGAKVTGKIIMDGVDINGADVDPVLLRTQVGMVFQKPNPFPKSIYDNVAYGPRIHGLASGKQELDLIVKKSLKKAGLWKEVSKRLDDKATELSGGQQQRLCIARAIAVSPAILLMDEPCSALDPVATAVIEELIDELKRRFTIIMVTHSMQQAARVSKYTAYFHLGTLVEQGETRRIFTNPKRSKTEAYISGKIG